MAIQPSSHHVNKKRASKILNLINATKLEVNKTEVIFFSRETNVLVSEYKLHESHITLPDSIKYQGSAYVLIPDFSFSIVFISYFRTPSLLLTLYCTQHQSHSRSLLYGIRLHIARPINFNSTNVKFFSFFIFDFFNRV